MLLIRKRVVVLRFQFASESPEGLNEIDAATGVLLIQYVWAGCSGFKFPGDAGTTGLGTTS